MIPNPILKVLSTFKKHNVECLLIGGQACIIYGAAEFSRDSDFVVLVTKQNLENLKKALNVLRARLIYVPSLDADYLERGHACHFICGAKEINGLRVDIIAKLRGCDSFEKLWKHRKVVKIKNTAVIDIIGLEDLLRSKKTQRDKDWFMLKRLVENDVIMHKGKPTQEKIKWWLFESRNAQTLVLLAKKYPEIARKCAIHRALLKYAINQDMGELNARLNQEEFDERKRDIEYWKPLKKELELLRHQAVKARE